MSHLQSKRAYKPFGVTPTLVHIAEKPPGFAKAVHGRGAKRDGLLYQQKVTAHFETLYGFQYLSDLWINYFLGNEFHTCSPDGVLIDLKRGRIVIVEVKRTHTPQAFLQLRNKYLPILQEGLMSGKGSQARSASLSCEKSGGGAGFAGFHAPPPWEFFLVEVCPAFDPLQCGEEINIHLTRDLERLLPAQAGMNVVCLKKNVGRKW
jgi:hypothetical protein